MKWTLEQKHAVASVGFVVGLAFWLTVADTTVGWGKLVALLVLGPSMWLWLGWGAELREREIYAAGRASARRKRR